MKGVKSAYIGVNMRLIRRDRGGLHAYTSTCAPTLYKVGNFTDTATTWGSICKIVRNWLHGRSRSYILVREEKEVVTGGKPGHPDDIKNDRLPPVTSGFISNIRCTQLTVDGRLCQHNLLDFLKKVSRPAKITMLEDRRKQQLATRQGVSRQIAATVLSVCASYLSHTTLIQKSINVCRQAQGFMFEPSARWATCGLINMQNGRGISC